MPTGVMRNNAEDPRPPNQWWN